MTLSERDYTKIERMGFSLFESDGSSDGPLQIQRIDYPDDWFDGNIPKGFEACASDQAAWRKLKKMFIENDATAISIFEQLRQINPIEILRIMAVED